MLSHGDLVGSGRLQGVRAGAVRSSERCAIISSVGRFDRDREGGGCAYGDECEVDARCGGRRGVRRAMGGDEDASAAAGELRDALRSFWRRFWNHMVTTLGSLSGMREQWRDRQGREIDRTGRAFGRVLRVPHEMGGRHGGRVARAWRAGSR